ncbi:MAG: tRNA (N6-threonylcarbamoyladenosine(37)-N6)-methyltransferase TrmO [Agathobaculum desmolans]|uniref:tRNA (N6-threonylcarbamoyladenosine(37)-N6)-methyltransferase TrmO n=1 Tax=Agathobaculum desmolans TaxID=39484 RepID=UPI0004E2793B|nr:tRNA (N6-threonylcarbamoyladenosine(37)-N6)-methyltransferase TrmO [Agathobaculum desmolans]
MLQPIPMQIIARIRSDFPTKFGIPRQSGLADVPARIVFEPPYRNADALRGIEGYSHLWLIWHFSEAERAGWSPTVRPPKLGGNRRMGVFATRSPFRPNAIGLSSVRLGRVELHTPEGPVLYVSGADLMDGTPLFDIKPYLAYTDAHPEAAGGFADPILQRRMEVDCPPALLDRLPPDRRQPLLDALAQDPRPGYQAEADRVYGFPFAGFEVRFAVSGDRLTVTGITPAGRE